MPSDQKGSFRKAAKAILHPVNIAKTIASQIPVVSAGVEVLNQIEAEKVGARLQILEETDVELQGKLRELEQAASSEPPPINDWSSAVAEYHGRIVELAINYDIGFHLPSENGKELTQPVAHGCMIDQDTFLVCSEAMELARNVSNHKQGRIVMLSGLAEYNFKAGDLDTTSGLILCQIAGRNEEKWSDLKAYWEAKGLGELKDKTNQSPVKFSITAWQGEEFGFLHSGEAKDVMENLTFSPLQFDVSYISHVKKLKRGEPFKRFVSGVLSGRFLRVGSPVFTRDGKLLGIISGSENYTSDAGRRAIVNSLLGHPWFMKRSKLKRPS